MEATWLSGPQLDALCAQLDSVLEENLGSPAVPAGRWKLQRGDLREACGLLLSTLQLSKKTFSTAEWCCKAKYASRRQAFRAGSVALQTWWILTLAPELAQRTHVEVPSGLAADAVGAPGCRRRRARTPGGMSVSYHCPSGSRLLRANVLRTVLLFNMYGSGEARTGKLLQRLRSLCLQVAWPSMPSLAAVTSAAELARAAGNAGQRWTPRRLAIAAHRAGKARGRGFGEAGWAARLSGYVGSLPWSSSVTPRRVKALCCTV